MAIYPSAFHSVMFNPVEPRLIATANSKEGVGLWDIRKPRRSDFSFSVAQAVAAVSHFPDVSISRMAPEPFSRCWCCSWPAGGAVGPQSLHFSAFHSQVCATKLIPSVFFCFTGTQFSVNPPPACAGRERFPSVST